MTDTNRPIAFEVWDETNNWLVSSHKTHEQALTECNRLEKEPAGLLGWRFVIRPVRSERI